ncbi:MAG: hypothetical protein HQL32_11615 [Planctomycetes bacterium]|nr:hypothetical protein [Planctomycetota bacterium]
MSTAGWLILSASVCGVTTLFSWCIYKVLTTPGSQEHLHGFEVETPDHDT